SDKSNSKDEQINHHQSPDNTNSKSIKENTSFNETNTFEDKENEIDKADKKKKKEELDPKIAKKKRTRLIIITIIIIVLVGAGIAGFVAYKNYQKPIEDFNAARSSCLESQEAYEEKLESANKTLKETKESDLQDPKFITELSNSVEECAKKTKDLEIPEKNQEYDNLKTTTEQCNKTQDVYDECKSSLEKAISSINTSKEQKKDAASNLTERGTSVITDKSGYEIEYTLKTTAWIKSSDTDRISKAWKKAGTNYDPPTISQIKSHLSAKNIDEDSGVVLVGSVKFTNKTSNYNISSSNKKNPKLYFTTSHGSGDIDKTSKKSRTFEAVTVSGYTNSSGADYKYNQVPLFATTAHSGGPGFTPILAEMTSNTWGECAFIIFVPEVFSPNYPNGDPLIINLELNAYGFIESVYYGQGKTVDSIKFTPGLG
ncbi:MAG: hypothetical protein MJ189_04415, partial [Coriobacteriales bacterium]|nr:hypothetical protein [Coriobacteriales bacterium]